MHNLLEKYLLLMLLIIVTRFGVHAVISISGHGQFSANHYIYNTTTESSDNSAPVNALQRYQNCLYGNEVIECFKQQTVIILDDFTRNNESIVLNDYIQINRNSDWNQRRLDATARSVESVDELLANKLVDLAESRSIQIKFPVLTNKADFEEPTGRQFQGNIENFDGVDEGRKKKGGGKHGGYLVGAMAIAAVIGQLALGKIAFLAGAAILLAKIALLLSLLSALKKHGGGSGSGEHVVLAADHGHSSYNGGGWQRSIDDQAQEMAFRSQIQQPDVD